MVGKNVNLSLRAEKRKRKVAYKKRIKTMKKNLTAITTLCDIEACLIAYPKDTDSPVQPEVWPSNDNQVQEVIARFKNMTVYQQKRNMENHESQLQKMFQDARKKMERKMCADKRTETTLSMFKCLETREVPDGLSIEDANAVGNLVDNTLVEIEKMIEKLKRGESEAHKNQARVVADVGASGSKGKEAIVDDDDDLKTV